MTKESQKKGYKLKMTTGLYEETVYSTQLKKNYKQAQYVQN